MIIPLPINNDLERISYLYNTKGAPAAIRYLYRVTANMQQTGNAQIIPISKKPRCTVQSWPVPPQPAA